MVAGSVGVAVETREAGAVTDCVVLVLLLRTGGAESGTDLVALALRTEGAGAATDLVILALALRTGGVGAVTDLIVLALLLRTRGAGAATNLVALALALRTGGVGAVTDLAVLALLLFLNLLLLQRFQQKSKILRFLLDHRHCISLRIWDYLFQTGSKKLQLYTTTIAIHWNVGLPILI